MSLLIKFIELNWQAIIAICALAFSIWQGWQIRRHNKLSVRPNLTTRQNNNDIKGFYKLELINNGLGPALIKKFLVKMDGKVISEQEPVTIENMFKIMFPNLDPEHTFAFFFTKDSSIAAKDKQIILYIKFLRPFPSREVVAKEIARFNLEITYSSFYGEQFHLQRPT